MSEVVIDINKLPTIDTNTEQCMDRCRSFVRNYSTYIIFSIVVLIVVSAIVFALLNKKQTNLPCILYDLQALASSVSLECIQYIWNTECPSSPYTFPAGYSGWWRSSPQGGVMVRCGISGGQCGVGSYNNIIVYMQFCNLFYNQ